MELKPTHKRNHSRVRLENDTEARLFTSEGLGLFSVTGIRLAFDVIQAQAQDQWPVEITVSNRQLENASHRMSEEAASLRTLAGSNEYPDAAENAQVLQEMSAAVESHLAAAAA